jgi:hypothetical protein
VTDDNKKFLGRLYCLFGKHDRDRSSVRRKGPTYYAKCRYCGNALKRGSGAQWRTFVADKAQS